MKRRYEKTEQISKAIDKARIREANKMKLAESADSEADWLRDQPKMISRLNECREKARRLRDAVLRSEKRRKRLGEKLSTLSTEVLFSEIEKSIPA